MKIHILQILFVFPLTFIFNCSKAQKLAVVPYVSGINAPIDIKHCGDDRLFIADRAGRIRIIDGEGTLLTTPFLDINGKISSTDSEEGFLGIAFPPDYKTSGKFYVDYTSNIEGQLTSVIEEYKVSTEDSNIADVSSALTVLTQLQPASNHNGGNLMFGMDGYLYINFGDGGSEGDPGGYGQNKNTFLGKILRIDVSNSSTAQPYTIPPDNPFFNDATGEIKKEIWAFGVRNPWRSSTDRLTGDLWIADVGQDSVEEVDYQPVNAPGGRNYGWNIMEGSACYNPSTGCNMTGISLPLYDYPHSYGHAITGGYVYRSAQSKALFGTYIFADYIAKWIDGIQQSAGVLSGSVTHFITAAEATGNPISFGEDRFGDQYILFNGINTVFQLTDTSYLRRPKAYFTHTDMGGGAFLFQGLQGRNLTYQWLRGNSVIPGATAPDYTASEPGSYRLLVTNALDITDTSDVFTLGALPLELTSFVAQKGVGNKIKLTWKTASEQDILGFTVLRRQNSEPSFTNIGFVKSKSVNGSSSYELSYDFTDSSESGNSKLYYRLQIENRDGSHTLSDIRTIASGLKTNSFTIFPNPAKKQVQIYFGTFVEPLQLIIFDNTGKKVREQSLSQQSIVIDLPVPKGVYILQVSNQDGSGVMRKKLLVR